MPDFGRLRTLGSRKPQANAQGLIGGDQYCPILRHRATDRPRQSTGAAHALAFAPQGMVVRRMTGHQAELQRHTPAAIHPPFSNYAHGVSVPAGARLLFCSGQLGIAPDADVPSDAGAQTLLCFANIRAILADAGMAMSDIVRINAFVTDRAHLPAYMAARNTLFPDAAPASTLMIVSGFAREIFKVEIEVIAAKHDGARP